MRKIAKSLAIAAIVIGAAFPAIAAQQHSAQPKKPTKTAKAAPAKPKAAPAKSAAKKKPPVKVVAKLPRLLELGSDRCVPCKMMAPITESLAKENNGKLRVQFIDVWKDEKAAEKYKVTIIPTQIFFDANGKEFFRHTGYMPREDIVAKFKDRGIKLK